MPNEKCQMTNNKWQILNNNRQMGNDKCQMGNEKWQMGNEKWQMTNMLHRSTPPPPRPLFSSQKSIFPDWLPRYGIIVYIMALAVVSVIYSSYSLPWYYMLSGVVAVLILFIYGNIIVQRMDIKSTRLRLILVKQSRLCQVLVQPAITFAPKN